MNQIIRDGVFDLPDRRTLPPDGGPNFNRLIFSSSPYLLQHARNPVRWYEYSADAFAAAARDDKPLFLSIGYSTCHWCHVMEHESFEDAGVAALLNAHFIAVKVDREERPDVDHTYMTACQAMTGAGGWPLSVFATPDGRPFYAGTYFPKEDRFGRPGFLRVLAAMHDAWRSDRANVERVARDMHTLLVQTGRGASAQSEALADAMSPAGEEAAGEGNADRKVGGGMGEAAAVGADSGPLRALLLHADEVFTRTYDEFHGGFGQAPKFPMAHALSFLLRRHAHSGDARLQTMVLDTLRAMHRGGIYDHIGGGFCRYSTDRRWLIPHFEKMLYDNALLLMAYADAWQSSRDEHFASVARGISDYILSVMTDGNGAFCSAENADSEGAEGKFYVFTHDEFLAAAGAEHGAALAEYFGVTREGNFEKGWNVLSIAVDEEEWRRRHNYTIDGARTILRDARAKLYTHRAMRVHPSLDDKILVSWNGLMIAALARAGAAFGDAHLTGAGARAARHLLARARMADGRLVHRLRGGEAGIDGFLEDYAFLAWGLLELYEATFEDMWLISAVQLVDTMLEDFSDPLAGGLYMSSPRTKDLLVRSKDAYDGALPSGNGAAAWVLIRLARLTGILSYERRAEAIIMEFRPQIEAAPTGSAMLLTALDFALGPSQEIVIAASDEAEASAYIHALREEWRPHTVVLLARSGAAGERMRALAPYTAAMMPMDGRPAVYVCENHVCARPFPV